MDEMCGCGTSEIDVSGMSRMSISGMKLERVSIFKKKNNKRNWQTVQLNKNLQLSLNNGSFYNALVLKADTAKIFLFFLGRAIELKQLKARSAKIQRMDKK